MPGSRPRGIPVAHFVHAGGAAPVGQVVSGIGVAQHACLGVEYGKQAGAEHLGGHVRTEQIVGAPSTAPGSCSRSAAARSSVRVEAITMAAGTPLSVTSPITSAPGGRRDNRQSHRNRHLRRAPVARMPQCCIDRSGAAFWAVGFLGLTGYAQFLLNALSFERLLLLLAHQLRHASPGRPAPPGC